MKRVMCLYRVSTKGQVDPQDDIPMQRRECLDFISRQSEWKFTGELMEKGVSGYKISASKRDAIQEIRSKAERREFDILLVFMFDRLGRREDETPFLVQWFVEHGIEVWSTREGQQRIENRADKLINYIRYWQAGGESEKTSIRVKAAHSQMTADGIWRGGTCPYGYKLVHKGRIGKKNRPLYDLEIDEKTGPIIQEIFNLAGKHDCGAWQICNHLNKKYPDDKKVWTRPTVMTILKNIVYTGRMHMNDVVSEPIEDLRLISDAEFEFVQHALKNRILHRYDSRRELENGIIEEGRTKTSVYGATLLSGILYCGHCHKKLVGSYCVRNRKNHTYFRPIYRCYNGAIDARECDGQTVYSARIIEDEIDRVVHQYFESVKSTVDSIWKEQARRQKESSTLSMIKRCEGELKQLQAKREAIEKEIINCLMGESKLTADVLNPMLNDIRDQITTMEKVIADLQKQKDNEENHVKFLSSQYQSIMEWADTYDLMQRDEKKMVLAHLIERIEVRRDYYLSVTFYVALEDFRRETADGKTQISEAQRTFFTMAL
ncbi:MAG: recombinase family protein [Clostridia bacterium]|nr:recombinase family protein [Clostridia bacterium]